MEYLARVGSDMRPSAGCSIPPPSTGGFRVKKQTLQAFTPSVNKIVSTLVHAAAASKIVDLQPFLFEFALNTTTSLLFGESYSSLSKKGQDTLRDSFDYATRGVGIRVRLADFAPLYSPQKFRKACEVVRDWAADVAGKALKYKDEVGKEEASEKYPFIIDLWEELRDKELVRDQLLHILLASRDTTASLLSWTL